MAKIITETIQSLDLFAAGVDDAFEIEPGGMPNGDACLVVRGDVTQNGRAFANVAGVTSPDIASPTFVLSGTIVLWLKLGRLTADVATFQDDFNRADTLSDLGGNWQNDGLWRITNGSAVLTGTAQSPIARVASSIGVDAWVEADLPQPPSNAQPVALLARVNGDTSAYGFQRGSSLCSLQRYAGNQLSTGTAISGGVGIQSRWLSGNVMRVRVEMEGSTLRAYAWDWSLGMWEFLVQAVDATYPTGSQVGIGGLTAGSVSVDNLRCGGADGFVQDLGSASTRNSILTVQNQTSVVQNVIAETSTTVTGSWKIAAGGVEGLTVAFGTSWKSSGGTKQYRGTSQVLTADTWHMMAIADAFGGVSGIRSSLDAGPWTNPAGSSRSTASSASSASEMAIGSRSTATGVGLRPGLWRIGKVSFHSGLLTQEQLVLLYQSMMGVLL